MFKGACELDNLIFKHGQEALSRELGSFVEEFEVSTLTFFHAPNSRYSQTKQQLTTADSLAKTYVNITTCESKLKTATNRADLSNTQHEIAQTQQKLNTLLDAVKETQSRRNNIPFESEKEAFLKQQQERKKKLEQDIRREADLLDETYAKMTRESIYRNLVGSQSWFKSWSASTWSFAFHHVPIVLATKWSVLTLNERFIDDQ